MRTRSYFNTPSDRTKLDIGLRVLGMYVDSSRLEIHKAALSRDAYVKAQTIRDVVESDASLGDASAEERAELMDALFLAGEVLAADPDTADDELDL